MIFLTLAGAVAFVTRKGTNWYGRKAADRAVNRLAQAVFDQHPPKYILYLRPHWLDNNDLYINPYFTSNIFWPTYFLHLEKVTFDHILSLELSSVVACLGTKEMRISTGSINVPDTQWKALASSLIQNADTIIVIPGVTDGLKWELAEIARLAFEDRVLHVQPPELGDLDDPESERSTGNSVAAHWAKISQPFEELFGIKLPVFEEYGSVTAMTLSCRPTTLVVAQTIRKAFSRYRSRHRLKRWIG